MKTVIAGLGVQGRKRLLIAGPSVVATVDPVAPDASHRDIREVPLETFDAALLCVPDRPKIDLIDYLLRHGKHVLVEKPLLSDDDTDFARLAGLSERSGAVCYTAYNHRFEPHFVRMRRLLQDGALGRVYSMRMFYGNGTARLVRDSVWRDGGAGVLTDLGSHLLDTLRFWFADDCEFAFEIGGAFRHENRAFDQVVVIAKGRMVIQLEMTMLSWRNHFSCDVFAEDGSAHIDSLCKWGPSTFTHRTRILPSGRPNEESIELIEPDPTWVLEYAHFSELCRTGGGHTLAKDRWLNQTLSRLANSAGVPSLLGESLPA